MGSTIGSSAASSASPTLTIVAGATPPTYSGTIASNIGSGSNNAVSVTVAGAGTQILSGANTYTGTTTIASGTLSAGNIVVSNNNSNLGNISSAVILGTATTKGTLSYTGGAATYSRGFTVNLGGGEFDVTNSSTVLTISGRSTSLTPVASSDDVRRQRHQQIERHEHLQRKLHGRRRNATLYCCSAALVAFLKGSPLTINSGATFDVNGTTPTISSP